MDLAIWDIRSCWYRGYHQICIRFTAWLCEAYERRSYIERLCTFRDFNGSSDSIPSCLLEYAAVTRPCIVLISIRTSKVFIYRKAYLLCHCSGTFTSSACISATSKARDKPPCLACLGTTSFSLPYHDRPCTQRLHNRLDFPRRRTNVC
jgi:hypothetical protein